MWTLHFCSTLVLCSPCVTLSTSFRAFSLPHLAAAELDKRYKAVPNYDFERKLVGCKVQVYWSTQGQWFPGVVTRFNVKHRKWKVEYEVRPVCARACMCA